MIYAFFAFTIMGKGDYYSLDDAGNVMDTMQYKRGDAVKTYINPKPRISLSYQMNNMHIMNFYTRNTQYLHLIPIRQHHHQQINGKPK